MNVNVYIICYSLVEGGVMVLLKVHELILGHLERLDVKMDALMSLVDGLVGEREQKYERGVRVVELSDEQRVVLLDGSLTDREKSSKLNMSVGWVSKWKRRLLNKSVGA